MIFVENDASKNHQPMGYTMNLLVKLVLIASFIFQVPRLCSADEPSPASYRGFDGWWIRNDRAEVFICANPFPRVLAFRRPGSDDKLHVAEGTSLIGIRSRCHLPDLEGDHSLNPAAQPATATWTGEHKVRLVCKPELEGTGLQHVLTVILDETKPLLSLRHEFINRGNIPVKVASWAIIAVPMEGKGLLPYDNGFSKKLIHFRGLSIVQDGLEYGKKALVVDYSTPPAEGWFKIGTDSQAGWVAYVNGEHAMKSTVSVIADGDYPEDGATVTIFKWPGGNWQAVPFGEIEHNGPLTVVKKDQNTFIDQTVELVPVSDLDLSSADSWYTSMK